MRVFFDTSAFVKRYLEEPGTDKVIEICRQADDLVLSVVCLPEMISTLNRLVRDGKLPAADYEKMRDLILKEIEDAEICYVTPEVVTQTIRCLENSVLRAMDALHLGCALAVEPDLFVSSDRRQIEAADKERLTTMEV
jgi:predicted nucleic acid-binding protein